MRVFVTSRLTQRICRRAGQRGLVLVVWKYAPGNTVLEGLEKAVREAKKGLWVDPQPVPPWEWRKRKERE